MPLLAATNIELSFGTRRVLDRISLSVEMGERIGIVGRNGGGKSTLLKVLAGELKPDAGSVVLTAGHRLGYLRQDPVLPAGETLRGAVEAAFAELHELHERLHEVYDRMGAATGEALDKIMREQERIEKRIDALGGYAIDHKIDQVLHGLGFVDSQFTVPVPGLSGGQKSRASLAKLLLEEPSILLLDEPTNHLDIAGRLWLEAFLRDEFKGAVVLISHDRYLLDAVVGRIIEVEPVPGVGGRLIDYPGNYHAFREQRAARILTQQRAYDKQQTAFKKEEAYIRKYKAGQRAKQAKGRESKLERAKLETTIERPLELDTLKLNLPKAERSGDIVASTRGLAKSYPNDDGTSRVLFKDLDITIERGQRWGVIGPNGAGKTTLIRCILGEAQADAGEVSLGSRVSVGYFRQSHEGMDPEKPIIRYLQDVVFKQTGIRMTEQQARDLAGAFMFSGQDQEKELRLLSGGERGRAVLAGLLATAKNVLVLDEPTNHFDIPSAERLEEALRRPASAEELALDENAGRHAGIFDGTVILISHDRALLDACCDRLIILDGAGGVKLFLGTYSQWAQAERSKSEAGPKRKPEDGKRQPAKAEPKPPEPRKTEPRKTEPQKSEPKKPDPPAPAAASTGKPASVAPAPRGTITGPRPALGTTAAAGPKPKVEKSKWSWMRIEQIEEKIAQLGGELKQVDAKLAEPDVWLDMAKANKLTDRRDEIKVELEGLEAEWVRKSE